MLGHAALCTPQLLLAWLVDLQTPRHRTTTCVLPSHVIDWSGAAACQPLPGACLIYQACSFQGWVCDKISAIILPPHLCPQQLPVSCRVAEGEGRLTALQADVQSKVGVMMTHLDGLARREARHAQRRGETPQQ